MIKTVDLIEIINKIAPESIAESWDNCGMQINMGNDEVSKILVCLEITKAVIEEAKAEGADFILTHHPLYFREIKQIDDNNIIGNYTVDLIKSGISVYSAHTSFDKVEGGNNTTLCQMLEMVNVEKMYEGPGENDYVGYTGEFECEISLAEAVLKVKNALKLDDAEIRYTGIPEALIKKVGVCSGAGADLARLAKSKGCDLFITGDVKYHDAQTASETGIALIDAGHYGTEYIFAENMAEKLKDIVGDKVEIIVSAVNINPFKSI